MSEETEKKGRKHLTPAEWAEAKTLWELGKATLPELSERFGIRPETLSRKFAAEGIVKGAKAKEVESAVKEEALDEATIVMRRIRETKEDHYTWSSVIAKLTMQTIVKAQSAGTAIAATGADLKALNNAMRILAKAREERWVVLGLDKESGDPEELPELMVSVLTPEQIEEIQRMTQENTPVIDEELEDIIEEE